MKKTQIDESMLECLDDYLSSRGQNGSNEEGLRALATHYPNSTEKERKAALREWRKQMDHAD